MVFMYRVLLVTYILVPLSTEATFVKTEVLLSNKSYFCWTKETFVKQKLTFVGQKYFWVTHGVTIRQV